MRRLLCILLGHDPGREDGHAWRPCVRCGTVTLAVRRPDARRPWEKP